MSYPAAADQVAFAAPSALPLPAALVGRRAAYPRLAVIELSAQHALMSANSINVGRLIPQSFYYIYAAAYLGWGEACPTFVVPSGNLGNLCAGLLAVGFGLVATWRLL